MFKIRRESDGMGVRSREVRDAKVGAINGVGRAYSPVTSNHKKDAAAAFISFTVQNSALSFVNQDPWQD